MFDFYRYSFIPFQCIKLESFPSTTTWLRTNAPCLYWVTHWVMVLCINDSYDVMNDDDDEKKKRFFFLLNFKKIIMNSRFLLRPGCGFGLWIERPILSSQISRDIQYSVTMIDILPIQTNTSNYLHDKNPLDFRLPKTSMRITNPNRISRFVFCLWLLLAANCRL